MVILLCLMCYPVVFSIVCLSLNAKGLLPGTTNYRLAQQIRQSEIQTQLARTHALTARYRAAEDVQINKILALEVRSQSSVERDELNG